MDDEWRRETGGGETLKKRTGGGVGGESSWIERGVANGDRSKTERQTLLETRTGEVRGFGRGQDEDSVAVRTEHCLASLISER